MRGSLMADIYIQNYNDFVIFIYFFIFINAIFIDDNKITIFVYWF